MVSYCAARAADESCTQTLPYPANIQNKQQSSGTCDDSNDSCWIHVNSTIFSHALYLMVQSLGQAKAEQLYYATLTQNLTTKDDLTTAANAVKQTCGNLLAASDCTQVSQAFAQVGL